MSAESATPGPVVLAPEPPGRGMRATRLVLFLATGLAVPLYAFPIARVLGKSVDLATVFAAAFVLVSVPRLFLAKPAVGRLLFLAGAVVVPLVAPAVERGSNLESRQFAISYAHWLLVASFFAAAAALPASFRERNRLAIANWVMASLVAGFAIYQAIGIPRRWPVTGPVLLPGQREPFRFTWIGGTYLGGGYTRPTSVFLEPAWLGGYLCWALVLAAAVALAKSAGAARRSWPLVVFRFAAMALLVAAILATVSWGAYADLVVVAAGIVWLFLSASRWRRRAVAALLVPFLFVAAFVLAAPAGKPLRDAISLRWALLRETPAAGKDPAVARDSSWVRLRNVEYSLALFREHPLSGVGLGQFGRSELHADGAARSFRDPWCGWLAIAAEMGALGPLLLASAILLAGRRRARAAPLDAACPILLALAVVQQAHTGSYIDLWWWYPVSLAAVIGRRADLEPSPAPAVESSESNESEAGATGNSR